MIVTLNAAARLGAIAVGASLLGACASDNFGALPSGAQAHEMFPATTQAAAASYEIGPFDVLRVSVYEEPGLSAESVTVGADGMISLPLIGSITAQGKTPAGLAQEIEDALSPRYLVNPNVNVNVAQVVSSRVTVDGEVNQPGVFPISGPTSLVDVVAMARGTTRVADLDEVAILRVINGEQMAARFDLRAIRTGAAPNPMVQRGDTIVVGFDALTSTWRDVLSASPLIGIFTRVL